MPRPATSVSLRPLLYPSPLPPPSRILAPIIFIPSPSLLPIPPSLPLPGCSPLSLPLPPNNGTPTFPVARASSSSRPVPSFSLVSVCQSSTTPSPSRSRIPLPQAGACRLFLAAAWRVVVVAGACCCRRCSAALDAFSLRKRREGLARLPLSRPPRPLPLPAVGSRQRGISRLRECMSEWNSSVAPALGAHSEFRSVSRRQSSDTIRDRSTNCARDWKERCERATMDGLGGDRALE